MKPRRGIEKEKHSPAPCAAFSDWLSGVERSAELHAHWLFGSEKRSQAGLGAAVPAGLLWLRRPAHLHWAQGRWCWLVAR